jgi:uncharacterized protein
VGQEAAHTRPARVAYAADVRTRRQAWDILDRLYGDPRIRVLAEPPGLAPLWIAISKRDDTSHLLWTDDYLAAFAQAGHLGLATLDTSMRARYPSVRIIDVTD